MIDENSFKNFSVEDLCVIIDFYDNRFINSCMEYKIYTETYIMQKNIVMDLEDSIQARKLKILKDHCQ